MPGASEDRASEPAAGERAGPAPSPLAKQEARGAQGALAQRVPCAEACHRGDPGTGLRPRAEVWGRGHTGPPQGTGACLPVFYQPERGCPLLFFQSGLALVYATCLFLCRSTFPDFFPLAIILTPTIVHTPHLGNDPLSLCQGSHFILAGADPAEPPSSSLPFLLWLMSYRGRMQQSLGSVW